MPTHRAIAFWHDPEHRVRAHAEAFSEGCKRHGIPCEVRHSREAVEARDGVTVVWHYGLGVDLGGIPFAAYEGKAIRVGGDAGVWRRLTSERYIRISIDGQQLGGLMNQRPHPIKRFDALRISMQTQKNRGRYILVTGRSKYAARISGHEYGEWERDICERLKGITRMPIVLREKPKNQAIDVPGVRHNADRDCNAAILGAWAVICRSGNIGADCILLNVPCWAEYGPGAVYGNFKLEKIDSAAPLFPEVRKAALADIAAWQFRDEEIARGDLWAHLQAEGVV